jgi:hypothetical protein
VHRLKAEVNAASPLDDGTPEVHPLAGDPDNHLVQVPSIAWARTAPP